MGAKFQAAIVADVLAVLSTLRAAGGGGRGVVLEGSQSWGLQVEDIADAIEEKIINRVANTAVATGSAAIRVTSGISGAAAEADMTVTGITTSDEILKVTGDTGGTPVDLTDEVSITDTNDVQIEAGGTDMTGKLVEVVWFDASAA